MQDLPNRLLSLIERVAGPFDTECWLFQGRRSHASLRWNGQPQGAHRLSHIAFIGPIKAGWYVLHKCDVGGCINPDHLWQGTAQDNSQDALAKGRLKFRTKAVAQQRPAWRRF
ncbi:MAG: hypothetical protein C5B60_02040 [Chloroflexi bacterium]|nr:MAG: hypothetical protein C5B60_02040 [Chloroflexota bacterium]